MTAEATSSRRDTGIANIEMVCRRSDTDVPATQSGFRVSQTPAKAGKENRAVIAAAISR
jgi:hypothetical protein